jgi:hypothetical protein
MNMIFLRKPKVQRRELLNPVSTERIKNRYFSVATRPRGSFLRVHRKNPVAKLMAQAGGTYPDPDLLRGHKTRKARFIQYRS